MHRCISVPDAHQNLQASSETSPLNEARYSWCWKWCLRLSASCLVAWPGLRWGFVFKPSALFAQRDDAQPLKDHFSKQDSAQRRRESAGAADAAANWTARQLSAAAAVSRRRSDKAVLRDGATKLPQKGPPSHRRAGHQVRVNCDEQPARNIGKIFFRRSGQLSACSGSLIQDRLVLTASHCLYDFGSGEWSEHVVFIPCYPHRQVQYHWQVMHVIERRWRSASYRTLGGYHVPWNSDVGMILLKESTSHLGWLGTSSSHFDLAGTQAVAYGYPATEHYEADSQGGRVMFSVSGVIGNYHWACPSWWAGRTWQCRASIQLLHDDMTGGGSGGPWIVGTHVVGLNSNSHITEGGSAWSPWFNREFHELYVRMNSYRDAQELHQGALHS
mmetsp:Transcript_55462/g.161992  ORF Transcript_55462/g.161992 Transcript_55462/m.161992 type:complete len:387 (+) Transcript_55462:52-1212(+)